jgi:hypothetical protein
MMTLDKIIQCLEEMYKNWGRWNPRIAFPQLARYMTKTKWSEIVDEYEKNMVRFRRILDELEAELKIKNKGDTKWKTG